MNIKRIVILGAGSAGLLAALTLRRRTRLEVEIIRSTDIGVIGVGEGTTHTFPQFLLNELRLDPGKLFAEAQPTWKLGLRFLWGPRAEFIYNFGVQLDERWPGLAHNNGFYCNESMDDMNVLAALQARNKAFPRRPDEWPDFSLHQFAAFHIENARLVSYLEGCCLALGAKIRDGTVTQVERDDHGVRALVLDDGSPITADLYIDASGFRSELLGKAMGESYQSFGDALFCDRAVIGGWNRTDEPIKPCTTCETMDAGWAWQIEHEHFINRGYVYCSRFIDDDSARAELLAKNPKIPPEKTRIVRFRTGRYARMWVGNVVGIGNSSGFVEPLEATALAQIINQCRSLVNILADCDGEVPPGYIDLYNQMQGANWDEIRDFIAIHYRFNTRLETPFWKVCQNETQLGRAKPLVDFYMAHGPTSI
ncbi:MAG TPA: FAD-dependent oxidoreductase, partial [Chthoniobacteraceae bacterium]|nr:FAD-dependent oxidoreductase [Chthoniobacteraceae bacterium]